MSNQNHNASQKVTSEDIRARNIERLVSQIGDHLGIVAFIIMLLVSIGQGYISYQVFVTSSQIQLATVVKDYTNMFNEGGIQAWAGKEAINATINNLPTGLFNKDQDSNTCKALNDLSSTMSDSENNPYILRDDDQFRRYLVDAFAEKKETREFSIINMNSKMNGVNDTRYILMIFNEIEQQRKNNDGQLKEGTYNCFEVLCSIGYSSLYANRDIIRDGMKVLSGADGKQLDEALKNKLENAVKQSENYHDGLSKISKSRN